MKTIEKIDIHNSVHAYARALKKLDEAERILPENRTLIREFLDACALGKTVRLKYQIVRELRSVAQLKIRGQSIGIRSRTRYLHYLQVPAKYFQTKNFKSIAVNDIESFIRALDSDEIQRPDGPPYAEKSKSNTKKTLIIFLRWLYGENTKKYFEMTHWIDTRYQKKSQSSLAESDFKKLLSKCATIHEKVLIVSLFDSGARIEEFLNIRIADVECVKGEAPYFRMTIREEFSKTKGRLVPLFYSESYEIVNQWLAFLGEAAPEEPFFNRSYGTVQAMLKGIGSRAGIPSLHAHLFRHSSATYYANQGWNEFQLNKRYGWSSKSDMGREYVEQAKIDIENSKRVKEYESRQLGALEGRLRKQQDENRLLREKNDSIQSENTAAIRELEKRLAALTHLANRLEENRDTHKLRTSQSVEQL